MNSSKHFVNMCNCDKHCSIIVNESMNEIHFNGDIDGKSMSELIEKLLTLQNNIIKKGKKLKRKFCETIKDEHTEIFDCEVKIKPIKLYITTPGGYIYQVFSAIDTIQNMTIPVHTICKGFVASAGTLLSLAGRKKFMTENTIMMIHELRSGSWGKYTEMVQDFENSTNLMEQIKNYYIKHTKLTKEELDEQLKKDQNWNADKCLEKGLVDEIIKSTL
jgi:ATP-dependent Clp protease protease subunit